ncbi:MAG: hypothetical protein ACREX4_18255 [Gammaproteobacteria bacterium]
MNVKPGELSVEEQADLGILKGEWLPWELSSLLTYKNHPALYGDESKRKAIQYRYYSKVESAIETRELPTHERDCALLSRVDRDGGVSATERVIQWKDFIVWYPQAQNWSKAQTPKSVDEQRAAAAKEAFDADLIGPHLTRDEIHAVLRGEYPNLFTFSDFHRWWRKYGPFPLPRGRPKGRKSSR